MNEDAKELVEGFIGTTAENERLQIEVQQLQNEVQRLQNELQSRVEAVDCLKASNLFAAPRRTLTVVGSADMANGSYKPSGASIFSFRPLDMTKTTPFL